MNQQSCPVVSNPNGSWDVLGHNELLKVLTRHDLFSSVVSAHPAIPNGLDPPRHTVYRQLIDKYFQPQRVAEFEPLCRELALKRWNALAGNSPLELMSEFAHPYALDVGCAFVGWPESTQEPLKQWVRDNQAATREQNRPRLSQLAARFQDLVEEQLDERRRRDPELEGSDVTTCLLREKVEGRPLSSAEITSILRNWTVGELATMASSVGILAEFLAQKSKIQSYLRQDLSKVPYAIEEILRLHAPLWSNRRVVAKTTKLGGRVMEKGERLTLVWGAANRDWRAFPKADEYQEGRDHSPSLLYGAGIHVCPGAPLARLELRVALEVMLQGSHKLVLADPPPVPAELPATGWTSLWLRRKNS